MHGEWLMLNEDENLQRADCYIRRKPNILRTSLKNGWTVWQGQNRDLESPRFSDDSFHFISFSIRSRVHNTLICLTCFLFLLLQYYYNFSRCIVSVISHSFIIKFYCCILFLYFFPPFLIPNPSIKISIVECLYCEWRFYFILLCSSLRTNYFIHFILSLMFEKASLLRIRLVYIVYYF